MSKVVSFYFVQKQWTSIVLPKKNTTNKDSSVRKIKQNRLTLLSNCAVCEKI